MCRKKYNLPLQLLISLSVILLSISSVLAQTCNINQTAPDARCQNNGNDTITDLNTKLMWKRCSEGQLGAQCDIGTDLFTAGDPTKFYWGNSLQYVKNLNSSGGFAGYTDWRLPNRKELESLVEEACLSSAINIAQFPNTPNLFYWPSSRYPSDSIYAWGINFGEGDAFPSFPIQVPVRLVRDVQ